MENRMTIWGREFDLEVIYDCYEDEVVTEHQKSLMERFFRNEMDVDSTLDSVKAYCLEDENLRGETTISNIFKYVSPRAVYIKRDEYPKTVALLCDYKFDIEHGLAVVFEDSKFKEIVTEAEL